jgi:lysine 2,3-aminomutase
MPNFTTVVQSTHKDYRQVFEKWESWKWHMSKQIDSAEKLRDWINLTDDEENAIEASHGRFKFRVTPYYASLMDANDPSCPIRKQAIPSGQEFQEFAGADVDPVGDRDYRKTNRVVHKYSDRAILLVTETCPVYCRHCTRKFHTTDVNGSYFADRHDKSFEKDFEYIARNPSIRDVLLTGGDPLVFNERRLEIIISRLRAIPHVEIIRIGTRFPVLLPQRINLDLCKMLEKYHPIWVNTHFNHPKEITPESEAAIDLLLRHGIPVGNQSVLLKGVNDDLETMRALVKGLVKIRVRPYYLYHCDNVTGVSHFTVDIEQGKEIMAGLLGYTTGFAIPNYIITTQLGKIPISQDRVKASGDGYMVENYRGQKMKIKLPKPV